MRGTGSGIPWLETGLELDKGDEVPSLTVLVSLDEARLCPGEKPEAPER